MSEIYLYNNQLWKVDKTFEYAGTVEEFTVNPGTYLFICNGAPGGLLSKYSSKLRQSGGTSYGIISIKDTIKMYAVVGGIGGDAINNTPGAGGYNGGGMGGKGYSSSVAGAGGGGATDIRLNSDSLYSRIIVAGGGGGLSDPSGYRYYKQYCGVGGGIYGGPLVSRNNTNEEKFSTQENGYQFGIGMDSIEKTKTSTYGSNGAGGGGGGWYGGYSQQMSGDYSDISGGGGSGYVITDESYKPEGYDIPESIRFTHQRLIGGSSDHPNIMICHLTSYYQSGDKIIIPRTGDVEKLTLTPGEYIFKCWGCDGGVRNIIESSARGGYSQGKLVLDHITNLYAHTGGSGIKYATNYENTILIDPSIGYNGGGVAGDINNDFSTFGGGATDIRLNSDSLYSRIIVAGGAGGHGSAETSGNRFGASGGGLIGNKPTQSNYGTTPGPGTQTETPDDSRVGGSFGKGGNGAIYTNNGYGGAGGGGWYGGSGTYPDSGDDDKGGCGGSGYVLTESSNKPIKYLLDKEYYMTDTVLTTGGNDLPIRQSKIEINVLETSFIKIICKDAEGFKYFDNDKNRWIYFTDELPSNEQFMTYGTLKIINDDGLLNEYDIYVYNEDSNVDEVLVFNVVPPELNIRTKYYTKYIMKDFSIDVDGDNVNVDFNINASRHGIAEDAHIDFNIKCKMKDIPTISTKIYCIQGYTQGSVSNHNGLKPKEKTIEHIDLLPIGTGNKMPSRYKSYIGGFINGTDAITDINSGICCIHNRSVYSATLCNNSILRIAKLDMISNTSVIIKDIPKSVIGNTYYGDILVDDKYAYITSSNNDNTKTLWRIGLDKKDMMIYSYSPGNNSDYNFNAYGRMAWLNDHTIVIMGRKGLLFFDTIDLKWTWKQSTLQAKTTRDMIVGNKYIISTYTTNSNDAIVYDIENDEWFNLISKFNIKLHASYLNVGCYFDGKFYITQRNRLHIIDENTMTLEKSISTPYVDINPKSIHYSNGILYITLVNSLTLYIYDIKNDRFYSNPIPFRIDNNSPNGWTKGVSYKGYFFIPNMRLFTINFTEYAKYNIGYKYDRFIMITNKSSLDNQSYEYDDRFVTFTDDSINIHTGDISIDMKMTDNKNIKYCSMNKSEYTKIINQTILIKETENRGETNDEPTTS